MSGDPQVKTVIVSEGYLRERDGCVPRGPGDAVSLVRQGATLRGTPDQDHRQTYREEHHTVAKVTQQRDPRTGAIHRFFHVRPDK